MCEEYFFPHTAFLAAVLSYYYITVRKVIFSQASISHSVHMGGGCIPACTGADTPKQTPPGKTRTPWVNTHPFLGRHPLPLDRHLPRQTPRLSRRLLQRTVRILLECILVNDNFHAVIGRAIDRMVTKRQHCFLSGHFLVPIQAAMLPFQLFVTTKCVRWEVSFCNLLLKGEKQEEESC